METKLDVEKLINEVHARPTLWDITQDDYGDRMKRKECWEDITNIFADGDMTIEEKKKLGELLHKKWKNIRDRFAREVSERAGRSDGTRKKTRYMHAQQLQFLRDTVVFMKNADLQEVRPSTPKKRPFPAEENAAGLMEKHEKREKAEDDADRHFLLSLLPALAALPRNLNTTCRIELMQCISKYERHALQQDQRPFPLPVQYRNHQQPHRYPAREPQEHQVQRKLKERPCPTPPSPESDASYTSSFNVEEDSQFSVF